MLLTLNKPTTVVGAVLSAVLLLASAGSVAAAPPPGMRWSDQAFGGSSSRPPRTRTVSSHTYPRAFNYYSHPGSPVLPAPTPATVAIRGPDGVVRSYPVVTYPCR